MYRSLITTGVEWIIAWEAFIKTPLLRSILNYSPNGRDKASDILFYSAITSTNFTFSINEGEKKDSSMATPSPLFVYLFSQSMIIIERKERGEMNVTARIRRMIIIFPFACQNENRRVLFEKSWN